MRHAEADELLFLRRGHAPNDEGCDVWDRSGPDSMENIEQLRLAVVAARGDAAHIINDGLLFE